MFATHSRLLASLTTAGLGLLLLTAPLGAASAQQKHTSTTCTEGVKAFVGAGSMNAACDNNAAVVAGDDNAIDPGFDSIVGAGTSNTISSSFSVILGGSGNTVSGGGGAIVGGAGNSVTALNGFVGGGTTNSVTGEGSAIVGGEQRGDQTVGNRVSGKDSFLGGGIDNTISGSEAAIGGGELNSVTSTYGTIAGGDGNQATGVNATVAGGADNLASGNTATVAGGYHNLASGQYSFAAGFGSYANTNGSFVWSDFSQGSKHLEPSAANQFIARATGGVIFLSNAAETMGVKLAPGSGTWASASDRNLKRDVANIDDATILRKVAALPVSEWSYTSEGGVRHLGPMAQDFYAAFRVGEDDRHITSIDEDGVALAAIKALHADNAGLHAENAQLRRSLARDDARLAAIERRLGIRE